MEETLEQSGLTGNMNEEDLAFLDDILHGVDEHRDELDEHIAAHLQGWTLPRVAKVDLTIMRIAVYEMLYEPTIPHAASINEAVNLSKRYSDPKGYGFINGVLGGVEKALSASNG